MGGAITGDGGRKRKGIGTRSNVGSSPTFQPWLRSWSSRSFQNIGRRDSSISGDRWRLSFLLSMLLSCLVDLRQMSDAKCFVVFLLIFFPSSAYGIKERSIAMSLSVCFNVCSSVYLSARCLGNHMSKVSRFSLHVRPTYGRGLILLWRRWDMLCTSGSADDVMFTVGPDSLGTGKDNASGTSVL